MRFRNLALLAKQVWWMIENPDHLHTKVFKARYLKHTSFMEAGIGANPCYIWHSLMWSKDALRIWTFWKVGNGKSINTRLDAWIPGLAAGRITSNITYDSNIIINTLILPSNN